MKLRAFNLRDDINQGEYVTFRVGVESRRPPAWESIETLPIEILYSILVHAAIDAAWIEVVVEDDGYGEEIEWEWTSEFVDSIPAGEAPLRKWAEPIFKRWIEYKSIDPN